MYRAAAIAIQLVFYSFYLAKFFLQRKQQIRTNQMGKGNKPQRVLQTERLLQRLIQKLMQSAMLFTQVNVKARL